jgi:hypothetical protein
MFISLMCYIFPLVARNRIMLLKPIPYVNKHTCVLLHNHLLFWFLIDQFTVQWPGPGAVPLASASLGSPGPPGEHHRWVKHSPGKYESVMSFYGWPSRIGLLCLTLWLVDWQVQTTPVYGSWFTPDRRWRGDQRWCSSSVAGKMGHLSLLCYFIGVVCPLGSYGTPNMAGRRDPSFAFLLMVPSHWVLHVFPCPLEGSQCSGWRGNELSMKPGCTNI